jgi:chromosome segregation ATPase
MTVMGRDIHDLRDREATLTNQIADEREKDNPDEERLDDLINDREEVRGKIAEYETATEQAEQEVVSERW